MIMDAKVTGIEELKAAIRNAAEKVPENARKIMNRGAERIVKEAQLNAPVDDAELEDAIHIEKTYGDRGRLQIDIVVGGMVRGADVSRYAAIIHENYEQFKPGPATIAKRAANPGRYIGSKFLERAAQQETEKFIKVQIQTLLNGVKL